MTRSHTFTPASFDELMARIREEWSRLSADEQAEEAQHTCAGLHDVWSDLRFAREQADEAAREEFTDAQKAFEWGAVR